MNLKGFDKPLGFLLLLSAVVGLWWALATPPGQAPDEPSHFGYIQYLSREHRVPLAGSTYFINDPATLNPAAGHPPLYYVLMLPAYWLSSGQPEATQFYAIRIWGLGIFLLLIAVSYRFAKLVFPDAPYLQMGVPLLMIFHPQLAFVSSSVMSDGLLALLFTGFLYQLTILVQDGATSKRAAAIGLLLGLGMLTKFSFFIAYPVLFVVLGLFALRRWEWRPWLKVLLIALGVSLLVCGWYFVRNFLAFGGLQPPGEDPTKGGYGDIGLWELIWATRFRANIITSFLGNFSWLNIPLPQVTLFWFRRLAELAVVGLVFSVLVGRWRRPWQVARPWLLATFGGVFAAFVLSTAYFQVNVGGAQGRYLFPAVFPFWSLFLAGLTAFFPPRFRPGATAVAAAIAAIFGAWALLYEFIPRITYG